MLEFRVLGPLEVFSGGVRRDVPSRRQRALIARLLLSRGRVVSADALGDALWEDAPPKDTRHAVHTYVSRVRALLGPALVTRPPGYLLDVPPGAVDAERFTAGVGRAGGLIVSDPAAAVELLDELLALWRGAAYEEFRDSFAQVAAVRLDDQRLAALETRGEALISAGAVDRAVAELGELVTSRPLRERPHGQLMRALYFAGRQGDALDVYGAFRDRLRDELGLDPSPVLRQIHEGVLQQTIESPGVARTRPHDSASSAVLVSSQPTAPARPVAAMTSFVGREEELRRLRELTAAGRLVTVVGPGGIGKTRLAHEFAVSPGGEDRPVWWVDLAPAQEPDDVRYKFVDALGLSQPAEGRVDDYLVTALGQAAAVIVVDNCEHVIEAAAEVVHKIVTSCAGVVVVTTSREPLMLPGEQVLILAPLPVSGDGEEPGTEPPAVALFVDRFQEAGGPELGVDDRRAVAELCDHLDGLPLAIELAAARARSLGVAALAARPVLDLLARRGDRSRHRSLRAVVDWSHDLLTSAEKVLFRRLATFSCSFTLDDVEAVCADGALPVSDVAGSLAGLVDKSIVAGPERDGYRMLETIRAYAAEQLSEHGEETWIGAAHARHFVRFAEQAQHGLLSPGERMWASAVTSRVDELRVAHRWACAHDAELAVRMSAALADYANTVMRFELHEWAEEAAALPAAEGHPLWPVVLGSAAAGAWWRGDFDKAETLARRGVAAAPAGHSVGARPLLVLGDISLLAGRYADAVETYQQVARCADGTVPHAGCEALGGQAIALSQQGDLTTAIELADSAIERARATGAPGIVALSLYFAAECRLDHDPVAALELLEEARRLAVEAGALFVVGLATLSLASMRARTGGPPVETLGAFVEAIEHWRRVGNRTQQWVTLRNLIPVLVSAGHDRLACLIDGALVSSPVRLPVGVAVPEAGALAKAIAEAREHLGADRATAAAELGTRMSLDDLVAAVLSAMRSTAATGSRPDHAGSSR